jgi:predicted transcriptional regulator
VPKHSSIEGSRRRKVDSKKVESIAQPNCSRIPAHRGKNSLVSTLQEIKTAIGHLNARDKALLAAELVAATAEPNEAELEAALGRGLNDVKAGRVRTTEEVKSMIPRWTSKS